MSLSEDIYVDSFKPHLMGIVYSWASGSSFKQVAIVNIFLYLDSSAILGLSKCHHTFSMLQLVVLVVPCRAAGVARRPFAVGPILVSPC